MYLYIYIHMYIYIYTYMHISISIYTRFHKYQICIVGWLVVIGGLLSKIALVYISDWGPDPWVLLFFFEARQS